MSTTEIDLASRPSDVCRRTNGRPTPPGADFPHHLSAAVRFHSIQQPEDRLTDWSSGCCIAISGCCLRVFDK